METPALERDLFETDPPPGLVSYPITLHPRESAQERATRRIKEVLLAGHPTVLSFSSGKDSSVLVGIALSAARDILAKGFACPPVVVLHGNTGVEQPEIVNLAHAEIGKMQAYANKHAIPLTTRISTPSVTTSFAVRVIGGRGLPSFPDSRADCSTDWKVNVNLKAQREVFAELGTLGRWKPPVVMTGVRNEESIARDQRIKKRGEVAEGLWENELGALRLSPILDFSVDDIWEYIGLANAGAIDSYSDFAETMRIYKDAGGSSCVVVADMKGAAHSKPCGTRTGCWVCTRVGEDKSMGQMMASDPQRYAYLEPLAGLRNFISRTQYDWSRRTFVGRTIDEDGYISIGADTYSPDMLKELLRYTLSAQVVSGVDIISVQQLIGIDARWSQYAIAPPFTALKIYFEVMDGDIALAPTVDRVMKTPVPKIGKIFVGQPSFHDAMGGHVSGLRNVGAEFFHESCGHTLRSLKDGTPVIDVETDDDMTIDAEGAEDFLTFVAEDMIRDYCRNDCSDWTWGYKTYLQYGTICVAKGKSSQTHEILQRSQWRQAQGLHGQQDTAVLRARCDVLHPAQIELI